MGDAWITLSRGDVSLCQDIARAWQVMAAKRDRPARNGAPGNESPAGALRAATLGVLGEFCAKCCFDPVIWHSDPIDGALSELPDLDDFINVKATSSESYDLRVQRNNRDDYAYVLVAHVSGRTFRVGGWLWGFEAKLLEYWSDPTGNNWPAYFVPRDRPLSDLAELLAELRHRQAARWQMMISDEDRAAFLERWRRVKLSRDTRDPGIKPGGIRERAGEAIRMPGLAPSKYGRIARQRWTKRP